MVFILNVTGGRFSCTEMLIFYPQCLILWHARASYVKHVVWRWIRYLEESGGVVLFEDFQAVFHHAGGLAELHGAVGDLIAHHLIMDHTSD